ncbi:MAG: rhomboid family intramembrane serine protease [Smithellaceae bacterium]|jgi:rhomboid protease GluP
MSSKRKSILCPNCRKLISSDEPSCPYCGLLHPGLHNTVGIIRNIFFAFDPVMTIIYINIAFYILAFFLNPLGVFSGGSPFNFLSPSGQSLFLLGATGTVPVFEFHRFWTLISASFLHGGILHIAFNMMALYQLGPFVLQIFGFHRFLIIYILSGIAGFAASLLFGVAFTIGASANICGLIGAILYYGKSRGGYYGQAIYKQAVGWVIGLLVFGIIISGINNWAHAGGLLSGILFAFLMGYNEKKQETAGHKLLAYVCILLTAGVLIWSAVYSLIYVIAPSMLL